jgi:hypothetical protein
VSNGSLPNSDFAEIKAHGSNCDKLSFVNRFSFEKLHHKFCKAALGIKKTSCNISAKSELCKNSDKYFFNEKNAFSPFLESSWR